MDKYTATELAYKHGYEKGYAKAKSEIVHCKDCKHWTDGVNGCTDHVKVCKIGFYMVGENGYCVYGERKDGKGSC